MAVRVVNHLWDRVWIGERTSLIAVDPMPCAASSTDARSCHVTTDPAGTPGAQKLDAVLDGDLSQLGLATNPRLPIA